MALERAKNYLTRYGLADRIMEFPVSSATVREAAEAIGCAEAEIAKSLSFLVDDQPILVVAAGDAKVDNGKFKAAFHAKARMIPAEQVESLIGHAVGGVCPFDVNDGVKIYLDESLKRFDIVYPACGSSNSAVRMSLAELESITKNEGWVSVCKDPSGAA